MNNTVACENCYTVYEDNNSSCPGKCGACGSLRIRVHLGKSKSETMKKIKEDKQLVAYWLQFNGEHW